MSLLAMITTIAVINAPPRATPSREAALRIGLMLERVTDMAAIEGKPYRLEVFNDRYALSRWRDEAWVVEQETPRDKPGLIYSMIVDDFAANNSYELNRERPDRDQTEGGKRVLIDPIGVNPNFSIEVSGRRSKWVVHYEDNGEIRVERS